VSEHNYLTICVPLEEVEYADCPGCNLPQTGCKLYRSTIKIPRSIVVKHKDTYRVRSISGEILSRFTITNKQYAQYSLADEKPEGWFIVGEYLYFLSESPIRLVLLELIPEDPEEIINLDPCQDPTKDAPCRLSEEETFPVDGDLVQPMYQMTLEFMLSTANLARDDVNNSKSVEERQDKEN
jgi:hypothetical protein